jgi:hypothetical protein
MRRVVAAVVVLVGFAPDVRAELLPEFSLGDCAWNATHILVVDAAGKVVEAWKGDAKVGDAIPLDKLRLPVEQPVWGEGFARAADKAPKLKAERLVLFLREGKPDKRYPSGWRPARRFDGLFPGMFDISAAWVADGKAYTMQQLSNPGDLMLVEEGTVEKFKTDAMAIANRRTALDSAKAEPDLAKRAALLKPIATAAGELGRVEAVEALGTCGEAGVPVLRDVLAARPDKGEQATGKAGDVRLAAVAALARIGKPAQDDLVKLLETQRGFWTAAAPDLPAGWARTDHLANVHLQRLRAALANPAAFDDLPAEKRAVVRDLAKLWADYPDLSAKGPTDTAVADPADLLKAVARRWEK